jgi:hypothetical protein
MTTTIEPALVSTRDAADYLGGSSLRHISRLTHAGKIVAVKDGVRTKVDFPSLKAYFGSLLARLRAAHPELRGRNSEHVAETSEIETCPKSLLS